jgi:sulfur-oxidizing protein SoxX
MEAVRAEPVEHFDRVSANGLQRVAAALCLAAVASLQARAADGLRAYQVDGDAIAAPLADAPGDPSRGRAIVVSRQLGLCLLCHSGPFVEERSPGTLATNLAGAGSRWSEGQLRLRVADARRLNAQTIMPSYYRVDGLTQVGAAWQGRPLLNGQQIEDVVAFLRTLR